MYSQRQTFDAKLLPEISTNGRYVNYPATSISGGGGATSIYFNNIQALSTKNVMKDFMITYTFSVSATSDSGSTFAFIKDINNAMRTLVTVNGQISYESDGAAITPIFKTYSEKYKSVDNLNFNDIYTYEIPTGVTTWGINTGKRGVKGAGSFGAGTFLIHCTVPIYNELLFKLGGVKGLNIRIILDNNLYSITETTLTSSYTVSVSSAVITYTEYATNSDEFHIRIPHFEVYNKKQDSGSEVASDTRNTSSSCSRVFVHSSINGQVVGAHITATKNITTPVTPSSVNIDVNNNVNCYNASDIFQIYGRCKGDDVGYIGTLQDFTQLNMSGVNERGAVIMLDNHNLPINISTSDIYRFNARVNATYDSDLNNYIYLYTVYMYNAILNLTPEKSEIQYISNDTITSDILEHEDYPDELMVGGFSLSNAFSKVKNFFKKHPPSQILGKVGEVANVVNPNGSKFQDAINKGQQISNILGMGSTSLF